VTVRKVVIPAAGLGTRLYPATKSQPKEMLPLGRKPAIQLVAEEALRAGLDQILVITGQKKRAIEDHFDQNNRTYAQALQNGTVSRSILDEGRARFFYTRQYGPRGLGDAVYCARDFVGSDHFVVALGDAVIGQWGPGAPLLTRLVEAHVARGAAATIAVRPVPPELLSRYGIVAPAGEGEADVFPLADLVEKPSPADAPSNLAVTARYVFSSRTFEFIERTGVGHGGEVQLTDAIRLMAQEGLLVQAVRLGPHERRFDLGNFRDYVLAFIEVSLADAECGAELRERLAQMLAAQATGAIQVGEELP